MRVNALARGRVRSAYQYANAFGGVLCGAFKRRLNGGPREVTEVLDACDVINGCSRERVRSRNHRTDTLDVDLRTRSNAKMRIRVFRIFGALAASTCAVQALNCAKLGRE